MQANLYQRGLLLFIIVISSEMNGINMLLGGPVTRWVALLSQKSSKSRKSRMIYKTFILGVLGAQCDPGRSPVRTYRWFSFMLVWACYIIRMMSTHTPGLCPCQGASVQFTYRARVMPFPVPNRTRALLTSLLTSSHKVSRKEPSNVHRPWHDYDNYSTPACGKPQLLPSFCFFAAA